MGTNINIRITKYNEETNKYHEICLYRERADCEKRIYHVDGTTTDINDPYIRASIEVGRNDEMFDGMEDGNNPDGYGVFPWRPIRMNSLEDSLKEDIQKKKETTGYSDFHEIYLSEIAGYVETHPNVSDYDADDTDWELYEKGKRPKPEKTNPIKYLYNDICSYIKFADWLFWDNLGDYKILFYFDW